MPSKVMCERGEGSALAIVHLPVSGSYASTFDLATWLASWWSCPPMT